MTTVLEAERPPVHRMPPQDIFRMNQKQLEGAVRRMWHDARLEPARKAYLTQHIMASRYIVAQQHAKCAAAAAHRAE